MEQWYANLESREQKFVLAAAVFVIFAVLYMGVWRPVAGAQLQASQGVETWRESVQMMRSLRGRLSGDSEQSGPKNISQPLVVVVDTTLRARSMAAPQRSQPVGNNIRIEFENVSFDDVMLWLGDLNNQYALQVQSGSFTRTSSTEAGRVNAQITLGR